jgi:Uma2 family endonuclease
MPELPDAAYFTVPPNWVCEVLSPSTQAIDRGEKLPIYAEQGVSHAWLIDPDARTLEVFRLDGTTFRLISVHKNEEEPRAEPFDVLELELAALWAR